MQMTMSSVVRNYLRWFELKRCKKALGSVPLFSGVRTFWQRYGYFRSGESSADVRSRSELSAENRTRESGIKNSCEGLELAGKNSESADDF